MTAQTCLEIEVKNTDHGQVYSSCFNYFWLPSLTFLHYSTKLLVPHEESLPNYLKELSKKNKPSHFYYSYLSNFKDEGNLIEQY